MSSLIKGNFTSSQIKIYLLWLYVVKVRQAFEQNLVGLFASALWNIISYIKGEIQAKVIRKKDPEANN